MLINKQRNERVLTVSSVGWRNREINTGRRNFIIVLLYIGTRLYYNIYTRKLMYNNLIFRKALV